MAVTIETRYGLIRGTVDQQAHSFRGLPYARPPLGALRLQPPQPPDAWSGVRNGSLFPAAAPQGPATASPSAAFESPRQSEDCLYLNIWTPGFEGTPRPVLVWIHGGRFLEGSGSLPDCNGRRLARRGDIVVITLHYRLGALGFVHAPELLGPGSTNLGLRDQIAALAWIRSEIDAFGGDPANITLAGNGSGADSIAALLGIPEARRLFQRAILQSPTLVAHSSEQGHEVFRRLLEELDVPERHGARVLDLKAEEIVAAQQRCLARFKLEPGASIFGPVLDGDLLSTPPLEAIRSGAATGIPLLAGSNAEETKLFELPEPEPEWLKPAAELYRRRRPEGACSALDLLHAIESDRIFRAPTCRAAELQAAHEPRTYAYLFRGAGGTAAHGLEVPFVFGTLEDHSLREHVGKTHEATALARQIQDAWVAFSRAADPSHRGIGSWPAYAPPRRATMILGSECTIENAPNENERRFWQENLPG